MNQSNDIRIWEVNDMEWWIGAGTPESILAAYMAETGVSHDDATGGEDTFPAALDNDALDALHYSDSDEDGTLTGVTRTFREQLAIEVAAGGDFPRLFAASDY